MLRDSLVVIDALKIPARGAEHSLTESALFPFQVEPTHSLCVVLSLGNWRALVRDESVGANPELCQGFQIVLVSA
jgi:hypothetical protein